MYSFQNINLHFGDFKLFDKVGFVVSPGEKVALVGKNGAGKSTLFRIMTEEMSADSCEIVIPTGTRIGYLSQHLNTDQEETVLGSCLKCFQENIDKQNRLDQINEALQHTKDENEINKLLEEHSNIQMTLSAMTSSNPIADSAKILKGFGFKESQFEQPLHTLSGGWQMRVEMSKLLLRKPDLLLLDEPDNHLDIEALIWFESYLKSYSGAIIFISHDLDFMSNVATRILELANKKVHDYKLNYKRFIDAKALRKEKEKQAFTNQQKVIKEKERTIKRFMAKESKTKMAQSMQKQLNKLERVELTQDDITKMNINFPMTGSTGKIVVKVVDCYKAFGTNSVLEGISLEIERGQKVAFVGQNGQGKSTLVKIIADKIKHDKGTVELGHNVLLSYFAQDQAERLDTSINVLQTLENKADAELQTKCRKILGAFAFSGEEVEKKVSVLSGGEKSRLCMACLVSQKSNFLILDEPTNHLDIHAKEILKQALINYPGTLIIVSHDREILRGTIDITYEFRDRQIIQHLGDLDYVLEKRKVDNVRDLSKAQIPTKSGEKTKAAVTTELSYEERKKINRNISRIEKKIEQKEQEIKEINAKLMDPKFYNSPDSAESMRSIKPLEEEIEQLTIEWDEWVSKLPSDG